MTTEDRGNSAFVLADMTQLRRGSFSKVLLASLLVCGVALVGILVLYVMLPGVGHALDYRSITSKEPLKEPLNNEQSLNREEIAVLKAALHRWKPRQESRYVVLVSSTVQGEEPGRRGTGRIPQDMFDLHRRANDRSYELSNAFDNWVRLMSRDELQEMGQRDFWKSYRTDYPGATRMWFVSRPAIDAERNLALIYVKQSLAPLSGSRTYYLFERKNGKWVFKSIFVASIS